MYLCIVFKSRKIYGNKEKIQTGSKIKTNGSLLPFVQMNRIAHKIILLLCVLYDLCPIVVHILTGLRKTNSNLCTHSSLNKLYNSIFLKINSLPIFSFSKIPISTNLLRYLLAVLREAIFLSSKNAYLE